MKKLEKEIENLLPALQLLRNHITSVKQKLFRYNNVKQNYLDELSYIGYSIELQLFFHILSIKS